MSDCDVTQMEELMAREPEPLKCIDCIWFSTDENGDYQCDKDIIDITDPEVDYCDEDFIWNE